MVTFINTNGMAFFGPGSEWFWAALQFTALLVTFVAVYRQLRIAGSQRAVEQVTLYTRQFEDERMARHQLAILVARRDEVEIPRGAGGTVGNYFETLGSLTRSKHLDIDLLADLFRPLTLLWWAVLEPFVRHIRAEQGDGVYEEFEWLVGVFRKKERGPGEPDYDAARIATWLAAGAIEALQDSIRVEQALRNVVIASPDGPDGAQSLAPTPAQASSAGKRRRTAHTDHHPV